MAKYKKKCCQRYLRKSSACKDCPIIAPLPKKERKKTIRKLRRKAGKKKG